MENLSRSRRYILKALILLVGSSGLLWRYLTPNVKTKVRVLARVQKTEIPAEGALVFAEARVALLNQGGQPSAISLVCTHLGCTVTVTSKGIQCPCHGSEFDLQGRVLKGPADRALRRLQVVEREGFVEVVEV